MTDAAFFLPGSSMMRSVPVPSQQNLYSTAIYNHHPLSDLHDMSDIIAYQMERDQARDPSMDQLFAQQSPAFFQSDLETPPSLSAGEPYENPMLLSPNRGSHSHSHSHSPSTSTTTSAAYSPMSDQWIHPGPDYYPVPTASSVCSRRNSINSLAYNSHSHHHQSHHHQDSWDLHQQQQQQQQQQQNAPSKDLTSYGLPLGDGTWRCAYPGCTSSAVFRRGCDLRKHYNRHRKHLFCRHDGCPQAVTGGFSSKKDRDRHEAKHNPLVECEWSGCGRVFSRVDNMKDHVKRIHRRRDY
ncbi:putative C2H2 transcription factor [Aspergillus candidus]|uniref:C2H2-type domain-containing protein n=1 Tax=Aspergillus candidus TaxID=41067 RepID=A0A2I2FLG0_ASPCN|nr:hypothetical protein BDW47DRAFT_122508 [Aspergillus candidus]PLB41461.1 hypothetical protein BDW47DRAFT_122508 [Aspergillus candidus]